MDNILRLSALELNNHFKCGICDGYLVDATALPECAHVFCKSCVVCHFVRNPEGPAICPKPECGAEIHKTRPFSKIKNDRTLQTLLYKIFPEVYEDEMTRRKDYWAGSPYQLSFFETFGKSATNEDLGIPELLHCLPQEVPKVALLELAYDAAFGDFADLSLELREKDDLAKSKPVYYHVPSGTLISDIRLLLSQMFHIDSSFVFLLHSQVILNPELQIADVYRFYGQKTERYLKIGFIFLDVTPYPDQISQEAAIIRIMRKKPWNPPPAVSRPKPVETEPHSTLAPVEPVTATITPSELTDVSHAKPVEIEPQCSQQEPSTCSPIRVKKKADKLHGILSAKRNRPAKSKESKPVDLPHVPPVPEKVVLSAPKTIAEDKGFAQLRESLPELMKHISVDAFYRINGTYEFFPPKGRKKKAKAGVVPPVLSGKLKRKRSGKRNDNIQNSRDAPIIYTLSLDSEFSADEQASLLTRLKTLTGKNQADSLALLKRIRLAADAMEANGFGGRGIQIDGKQVDTVVNELDRNGKAIAIQLKKGRKAKDGPSRRRKKQNNTELTYNPSTNGIPAVLADGDGDHTYAKNPGDEYVMRNGFYKKSTEPNPIVNGSLELAASKATMVQPLPFPPVYKSVPEVTPLHLQSAPATPPEAISPGYRLQPFLLPVDVPESANSTASSDELKGLDKPRTNKKRSFGRPRKSKDSCPLQKPRLIKPKPSSESAATEDVSPQNGSSYATNGGSPNRQCNGNAAVFPVVEQKPDHTLITMSPQVWAHILANGPTRMQV